MEFRILGPLEVTGSGGVIRLGSRRERAVLGALVLGGGDVMSADRLIDALWGDAPPRSAPKTLQNYVLKLRKALGPEAIETQAGGYRLATETAVIDARKFDGLVRTMTEARTADRPAEAVELGREALALWRGDPLEELEGWSVARTETHRLLEVRRVAEEELVDAEIACGHAAAVVAQLEAMVAAEPLRERRWSMLMRALYREGRQADALRAFQRARTLLGDELGIEPGPELRALELAIATQDPSLDPPPPPPTATTEPDDDPNTVPPYKGLVAFEPDDRALFFGRDALVAELGQQAARSRFVAVIGPSGSGKSSLLRAGVLPTLCDSTPEGSDGWRSVILVPGARPLAELAAGIAPVLGCTTSTALDALASEPVGLAKLVRRDLGPGRRLAIVVDQFEELFTLCRDPEEQRQLVAALVHASGATDGAVTVVIALRADFYGHCAAFPAFARLLDAESVLLSPMEPDEIRAAIDGPADAASLHIEPGLTDLVLADLGGEPGALPLLSHALLETWKRRSRRTLTVTGYHAAGGVRGAIAQTAESVYGSLGPEQQVRARHVFLRLTELGDGTEDTSHRVSRRDLAPAADRTATDDVVEVLARARLVTIDGPTVQMAHEALLREWPRLRGWLDEDRDGRRIHRHLTHAARAWEELGHEPTELYRGPRLATVGEWLTRDGNDRELNDLEASFLSASTALDDAQRRERERAVVAKERSNRRLRRLLVAAAIMLVVALVAGTLAVVQRDRADDAAARARASSETADVARLVAQSTALAGENRYLGSLLALEANRARDDAQTQGALLSAVVSDPRLVRTLPTGTSEGVWALPDSRSVLVQSRGRLGVWDLATGARTAVLPMRNVQAAAVRSDGLVAGARSDGRVTFADARGERVGPTIRSGLHGLLANVRFSPDGRLVAVGYGDWANASPVDAASTVRLFDVATGRPGPAITGRFAGVTALAFSPDGRELATGGGDDHVVLHDLASGGVVGPDITVGAPVFGIAWDPVRDRLAIGTIQNVVDVVGLPSGARVGRLADAPSIDTPTYSPDGARLAVAGNGPTRLYDAATLLAVPDEVAPNFAAAVPTGEPIDPQVSPARVTFAPDGSIVAGGATGPATVWRLDHVSGLDRLVPGAPTYTFPMVGGTLVAAPDLADSVTLYDRRTLRPVGPPLTPGPGRKLPLVFPTTFAASYYDGSRIAVVNRSGTLQLFDVASRRTLGPPVETGVAPVYAVFSRDMRTIAVGGRQGEVRLVDVRTHAVRALPSPMSNYVLGLEFGPHGELAASDAGHVVLFTHLGATHPRAQDVSRRTSTSGFGMDLSPNGRLLALSTGGQIGFYDARTLHRIGPLVPASSSNTINWIAFDRSGTKVITGDTANFARLVDVPSHRAIGPPLAINVAGGGSVFDTSGKTVGTWTHLGGSLLSVDPAVWRREACALAGRNLTADEWAKYLPGQGPRQRTCPQYP